MRRSWHCCDGDESPGLTSTAPGRHALAKGLGGWVDGRGAASSRLRRIHDRERDVLKVCEGAIHTSNVGW